MSDESKRTPPVFSTRLVVGLLIIVFGAILLAGNLGFISARDLLRLFWPVGLIVIGVALLLQPDSRKGKQWGWVWLVVGAWVLADKLGLTDVNIWQLFLPGVFLFVGGWLVWRAVASGETQAPQTNDDQAEFVRSFAIMSGNEVRPISRPFRGADLTAVMGGIKLDLLSARMEGDTATIEVFSFWGGIEIHVPPDWTVQSKVTAMMGAFVDKRRPTSVVPTRTLIITGLAFMGGVEVKN